MTARNRAAFERGQRARAALREILASRSPLLPPLTLAELQAVRTVERCGARIGAVALRVAMVDLLTGLLW